MKEEGENVCKHCRSEGMKVVPLTLGVHVREEHWSKIDENFYFCPSRECDVVYFNNISGVYFTKAEVKTRVGIKENTSPKPVCYCNRVTDEMLRKAILKGCSSSMEEVQEVTGAGKGKWCITTNPSGRCCEWYLKDIINSYLREMDGKPAHKKAAKEQKLSRLVLEITGMTCQGCVGVVQGALESTGATNVKVSLSEGKAEMLIPEEVSSEKFIKAVRDAGYGARSVEEEKGDEK